MQTYRAQNVKYGRAFAATLLAALATRPAAALIVTGKLRLSTNPSFDITPGTAIADLTPTEANFSGYTAGGVAVVLVEPVNLSTQIIGAIQSAIFEAVSASPFVSSNVTAWWIDDGTNVICGEKFADSGVASLGAPGDWLELTAALPFGYIQDAS